MPKQQIDTEDHQGNAGKRRNRARQIAKARPVEAEADDRQRLDDDHEVGAVIAEHARQQQRDVHEIPVRDHDGQQRAQRPHEEAERHERAFFRQHRDRDQHHIDVAKMQRQLIPPVEAASVSVELPELLIDREAVFVEEKADKGDDTGRDQNDLPRAFALAAQQDRGSCQKRCKHGKAEEKGPVEGPHDKNVTCSHDDLPPITFSASVPRQTRAAPDASRARSGRLPPP